jgi:phosphate transport system substrate-binding protein
MTNRLLPMSLAAVLLSAPWTASAAVRYGGSSTLADTMLRGGVIQQFQQKTGINVEIVDKSGTGKGLKSLAEGKLDIAGSGRALESAEKKSGLLGTIVAYDGLAVYVNAANPVKDLSREQLKAMFTGRVKNWKEVDGADEPIVPIVEPPGSKRATVAAIQELVLDGVPFMAGIRENEDIGAQVAEVARSRGAVCIASIGFFASTDANVKKAVKPVTLDGVSPSDADIRSGAYLLSRPMVIATRGLPEGEVKAFLDFMLSTQGQAIVERFYVAVKK